MASRYRISKIAKITNSKKAAVAKALNRGSTMMPALSWASEQGCISVVAACRLPRGDKSPAHGSACNRACSEDPPGVSTQALYGTGQNLALFGTGQAQQDTLGQH